ncbi:hypothetical protein PFICI_02104 [Pestalotiopsis fici W106-1]|uniref:Uncharacterized protein n=1 Tax=Pestalotiopsis fici (strain W106-1 / CGMCC3.15140) TaxID=1229662 RepID=W3XSU7_PESFW|nr:uncharacterized protein PFICI_02104 [Pestalotiopsis fici W106-1]ETS88276.1 hypothetical protein PFICI_02104 [Pestalotiopsis fici W106-1]
MSHSSAKIKSDLNSLARKPRKSTRSTRRLEDIDFREDSQVNYTDEDDCELDLKADDQTIRRSKNKKRSSSPDEEEILYETHTTTDDKDTILFETLRQNIDKLFDSDLTKLGPDKEFWEACCRQLRIDPAARPSFRQSILKKKPKTRIPDDALIQEWWLLWDCWNMEFLCHKIATSVSTRSTEENVPGADDPESHKMLVSNLWIAVQALKTKLREDHSSKDLNAIQSIEMDLSNSDEYHDVNGNESDSAQEGSVTSRLSPYQDKPSDLEGILTLVNDNIEQRWVKGMLAKLGIPKEIPKLETFEVLLHQGKAVLEKLPQISSIELGTPASRTGCPNGSPVPGRSTQDSDKELHDFPSETPTSASPSASSSGKSTAAACNTPQSSSPPPTASPPKPFAQPSSQTFAQLMGLSKTSRPSPKAVARELQSRNLQSGTGHNKASKPMPKRSDDDNCSQDAADTPLERQRREETHPHLRAATENYQRNKKKVNRGDIVLKPSHLVPQTMWKPVTGTGAQKGKKVASNTSNMLSHHLPVHDQPHPTAASSSKAAVHKDNHGSDWDSNCTECIFPSDLYDEDDNSNENDTETQTDTIFATASPIKTDRAGSRGVSDDNIPEHDEDRYFATTPTPSSPPSSIPGASVNETTSRGARREKQKLKAMRERRKRNRRMTREGQSVQPSSPHAKPVRIEHVRSPTSVRTKQPQSSNNQSLANHVSSDIQNGSNDRSKKRKASSLVETIIPQETPDNSVQVAKKQKRTRSRKRAERKAMNEKLETLQRQIEGLEQKLSTFQQASL